MVALAFCFALLPSRQPVTVRASVHAAAAAALLLAGLFSGMPGNGVLEEPEGLALIDSRREIRSIAASPPPVSMV